MAFQRLTSHQRHQVDALRQRAWAAGLAEATFSQIAKDPEDWELQIRQAELDAKAQAEREAAEATKPAEPAALIAQLRQAGMTVQRIAAAIGVHASTVYRWARGAFRPQAVRLAILAALAA